MKNWLPIQKPRETEKEFGQYEFGPDRRTVKKYKPWHSVADQ